MDAPLIRLAVGIGLQNYIGWFPSVVIGLMNIVPVLMSWFFNVERNKEFEKHSKSQVLDDDHFDFIVVGAGVAGSVVANRLSKHFSVLLLERGGEPNILTKVPGMEATMTSYPEVDYRYLTVPQNLSCFAMNNRQCLWNSGFGLGGSHNLNSMVYIRGHPFDYQIWANRAKDERWSYEKLVPFFTRSEQYCDSCEQPAEVKHSLDPKYHGYDGELPIRPPPIAPLLPEFLDALAWAGVVKKDLNAPYYQPVVDAISYTQKFGRRVTTFDAFVAPILDKRPNLKLIKFAQVIRVLFDEKTNQAIGIEYESFGKIKIAKCNKEVILSAGAVATPKILLLSGIGPAHELAALGIPVRANLPVGRNLQDHIGTFVGPFLINKQASIISDRDMTEQTVDEFLINATGPYTLTFPRAITLWTSSKAVEDGEANWPDIELGFASSGVSQNTDEVLAKAYNLRPEIMKEFIQPIKGRDAYSLFVDYGRPRSRGFIKLQSANYQDDLYIDPRSYEDPADIRVQVEGCMKAVDIMENAPAMKKLDARLSPVPFPLCKHLPFRSANYWACFARSYSLTIRHYCCTTALGHEGSPEAVVDAELRVIGTKGLRVMDTGIMPVMITINPMASTIMIGERGAQFVLDEWLGKQNRYGVPEESYNDYGNTISVDIHEEYKSIHYISKK